ncbi:MAG: hypothetical protein H6918_08920 [Sphingomonadaceae bacterium]|nr:hypothetical protein [Sphingomonadaceae bacterium]
MFERLKGNRQFRYRLYFWLMDISLVCGLIGFADFIRDDILGYAAFDPVSPIYIAVGVFCLFFSFPVATFLVLARFMRDEYAEQLWQRTIGKLGFISAVVPFSLYVLVWTFYFIASFRILPKAVHNSLVDLLEMGATEWRFDEIINTAWMVFMLLFVAIFQFLRWRDSR